MSVTPPEELLTLRDWLRHAVSRMNAAGLAFGHGSTNAYDEAAYLLLHALHLPPDRLEVFLAARLTQEERARLAALLHARVDERKPAAYLTHEAWLGEYRFYVDERVIVPRSYFAELLFEEAFAPWLPPAHEVSDVIDMCTGSGCLAILLADAFPYAAVDAVDLSEDALAVAARNVADYALEDRVRLVNSDLFAALAGRQYDFILSNPPYVTEAAMDALPAEYRHEPAMALGAGADGLDIVRRLFAAAPAHLKPHGIMAVEVGHNRDLVEAAFPTLPLTWMAADSGDDKVFVVEREALLALAAGA